MIYLRKLWEFVRQKGLRTSPGSSCTPILPLHLRILRDLLRPDVERVLIDQPSAHREMLRVCRGLHPGCVAAHRAVRRAAADFRAAPRRGGDSEGARSQGLAEIGRLSDHRPDRGDDDHRREHRRFRRPPQSRGDDLPHQSRGRGDHRAAAAPAQSGRHHHHRLHRHGGARASPAGDPGAGEGARRRPREDQHLLGIAARAGGDDAQAHARKSGTSAVPGLSDLRGPGVRQDGRDGVLRGIS